MPCDKDDLVLNFGDNQNHFALDVTDSDSITESNILARKYAFELLKSGKQIMSVANAIAPREGRRIVGLSKMLYTDYLSGKVFPDSVCYSYWFVDIHRMGERALITYVEHDKTPSIRLSSMISKSYDNLMMAGRNISSDRKTNSAIRVKASCMAMGQAVGTACSLFVKSNMQNTAEIDAEEVKTLLSKDGAIVPTIQEGEEYIKEG
jgi:hypothetical protein